MIKQIFTIIIFLFLYLHFGIFEGQGQITTIYNNLEHSELNINLKGKVKILKQISYSPYKFCDTIPYSIDTSYYPLKRTGEITLLRCTIDSIIYNFNNNSTPAKILNIHCYIDYDNRFFRSEAEYSFQNGNLISEMATDKQFISYKTTYSYDELNNLKSKEEDFFGILLVTSFSYDNNNKLIRELTMRYEAGRRMKSEIYSSKFYEYDSIGHLVATTFDNNRKSIYVYDIHGNKIEEGRCENYKGKKCKYKPSEGFVYDQNNRLVKRFSIGNWQPHNTDSYDYYDAKGNIIEAKGYYITKDTVLGYHYVYEYNETGQQIKEEEKVGHYRSIDFEKYKFMTTLYDKNNNISQQSYYLTNNQPVKLIRYGYTYDSFGNWIRKEKYQGKSESTLKMISIDERIIEYY